MAAKQGTLAQLSAQAEDAKRAVLSKAGSVSWFSTHINNNTVCTIKSAPPRSPEVLSLLATKAGWLYKRNEQHVWQARWCCVVPHTFLYYFDAPVVGNSSSGLPPTPAPAQQEAWNRAVLQGLGRHSRKPHEKRSHFPLFNATTTATAAAGGGSTTPGAAGVGAGAGAASSAAHSSSPEPMIPLLPDPDMDGSAGTATATTATGAPNVPPAGIIDLECYTTLYQSSGQGGHQHENSYNPNAAIFLQLAGDDQVNPDLRPFYFCSDNANDVDEWNAALLQHRHGALHDEVEAYKQVADSFAQQLQELHVNLDSSIQQHEESQQELYRVRSAAEETRRTIFRMVEECWDRPVVVASTSSTGTENFDGSSGNTGSAAELNGPPVSIQEKRTEYRRHLETIKLQDMGACEAVRLLTDYVSAMEELVSTLHDTVHQLRTDVQTSGQTDQAEILELQAATQATARQHEAEREQLQHELVQAQTAAQVARKELRDVQNDLNSTKTEVSMLMQAQKNKLVTQKQHKEILKKEVIGLRQKVEDVVSEHSSLQHEHDKIKLQLEQERNKSDLLSRYIDKMESQVQVQQNMMEMMSQAGGGSVYGSVVHQQMSGGRSIASRNNEFTPNRRNINSIPSGGGNNHNIPTSVTHRSSADAEDEGGDRFDLLQHHGDNNMDDDALEDFENDEKLLLQQPNIPTGSPPHNHTRQQRRPSHSATPQRHHLHMAAAGGASTHRRGTSYMSDHDVDNKSHVSELTEDRTQREFTLFQNSQQHFASSGGYEVDAPQSTSPTLLEARFRKRLQEQRIASSPRFASAGPPSVIIGVKKTTDAAISPMPMNDSTGGTPSATAVPMTNGNVHRELETIQYSSGSVRSMPVNTHHSLNAGTKSSSTGSLAPVSTVPLRRDIPRSSSVRDAASITSEELHAGNGVGTADMDAASSIATPPKLTVAQRARREADSKSTPVRARLDESSLSALKRKSSGTNLAALANLGVTTRGSTSASNVDAKSPQNESQHSMRLGGSTTSPQHSQSSGLWRRMEEAVLGPRSDEDDEEGSYTCSEGSTRVTDLTDAEREENQAAADARVESAKKRFAGRGGDDVRHLEEKKSCDTVSISNLSLQERCRLQRDKQLRFLREQGLLQYAADMKGGAGCVLDSASVTSSSFTPNGNGNSGGASTVGVSNMLSPLMQSPPRSSQIS